MTTAKLARYSIEERWKIIQDNADEYFSADKERHDIKRELNALKEPETIFVLTSPDRWQSMLQAQSDYEQLKSSAYNRMTDAENRKSRAEKLLLSEGLLPDDGLWVRVDKHGQEIRLRWMDGITPILETRNSHVPSCEDKEDRNA